MLTPASPPAQALPGGTEVPMWDNTVRISGSHPVEVSEAMFHPEPWH